MIGLIQRVTRASVRVGDQTVGEIGSGLLVFVCAERGDRERQVEGLVDRVISLRVFPDATGRMNLSVRDAGGALLLVPQFTLAADTRSGTRPSFTPAAPPEEGERLFRHFIELARQSYPRVATGEFGAMMQVELVNDGPVTFWLRADPGLEQGSRAEEQ
ncbi:MAG TPA: D-aminoacyl-tRNA deacylase [Burkholderiaceae bacterium]|nr:D-aminoacyl-tRNA deacylase [Burkholderiaceae bacterium]